MNKIASFTTPFTTDVNSKFQLFHLIRRKIWYFILIITLCAASIGMVIFQALTMGDKFNQSTAAITIILMFVLLGMYFMNIFKGKKVYEAQRAKYGELVNTCEFYDEFFTQENNAGKLQLEYSKIFKIYETKDFFYVYFTSTSACVIQKDKITFGSVDDLKSFLLSKLSKKQLSF